MKHYTFYRENNDFRDILEDSNLKRKIKFKIRWDQHLLIAFEHKPSDKLLGYIVLKYGDDMKKMFDFDYSPVPNVDYIPKRN